jgi:ATP-dependent DNA ligase
LERHDTHPPWLTVTSRPDTELWIHPSKSLVLELKATEFAASKAMSAGMCVRFPRFKRIRTDISYKDVTLSGAFD